MPSKMINEIRANKKDILKSIQNNSAAIIDVRSPEVYAGMEGNCKRQGHVKGAINHYWKLDIETLYQWKSIDVLRSSYSGVSQKTILVCEDGWSAAHTYFTLRYILNQNSVQLYDGGMGEWANSTDLPMEKSNTEIQVSGSNY
jgi:thiosulfate/3-mercaptopyruvate sulfurtransferase